MKVLSDSNYVFNENHIESKLLSNKISSTAKEKSNKFAFESDKLNEVFDQYDSQLLSQSNRIVYKCLMDFEGCAKDFRSKRDMYAHLVTECEFFICRLCSNRCHAEQIDPNQKQSIIVDFDKQAKPHKQSTKPPIKPQPLTIEQLIQLSIIQVKQASFLDIANIDANHSQNLYSAIICSNDLALNTIKAEKFSNYNPLNTTLINYENIKEETSFIDNRADYQDLSLHDNLTPKSFKVNKLFRIQSKLVNNKNLSIQFNNIKNEKDEANHRKASQISYYENREDKKFETLPYTAKHNERIQIKGKINNSRVCNNRASEFLNFDKFSKGNYFTLVSPAKFHHIKFKSINATISNFEIRMEFKSSSSILSFDILNNFNIAVAGHEDGSISLFNLQQRSNRKYSHYNSICTDNQYHFDEVTILKAFKDHREQENEKHLIVEEHKLVSIDRIGTCIIWDVIIERASSNNSQISKIELKPLEILRKLMSGIRTIELIRNPNMQPAINSQNKESIMFIFGLSNGDILCMTHNGKLLKDSPIKVTHHSHPVVSILYNETHHLLFTNCSASEISIWNWKNPKGFGLNESQIPASSQSKISNFKLLDKDTLAIMYDDNRIKIYSCFQVKLVMVVMYSTLVNRSKITSLAIVEKPKLLNPKSSLFICFDNKELFICDLQLPDTHQSKHNIFKWKASQQ